MPTDMCKCTKQHILPISSTSPGHERLSSFLLISTNTRQRAMNLITIGPSYCSLIHASPPVHYRILQWQQLSQFGLDVLCRDGMLLQQGVWKLNMLQHASRASMIMRQLSSPDTAICQPSLLPPWTEMTWSGVQKWTKYVQVVNCVKSAALMHSLARFQQLVWTRIFLHDFLVISYHCSDTLHGCTGQMIIACIPLVPFHAAVRPPCKQHVLPWPRIEHPRICRCMLHQSLALMHSADVCCINSFPGPTSMVCKGLKNSPNLVRNDWAMP